jgi:hypothetical protein
MSMRLQFLKAAVESFAAGAVAGLVANVAWFLATGDLPSLLTAVIAAQVVTSLWGAGQALRFRRKWQAVLASYNRPALGEGIDIPGRPPLDDEDGAA